MAELSVEEAQRLARQFLTGLAGDAEVGRLESALAEDQTLALELLAQMQSALEDVAPEGLTQDQVKSVDARVEALVGPRIRRRGFFGVFKRLFKRRRKPAPARVAGRAKAPEPAPAPAPVAAVESPLMPDGEGMEEMAPIAPSTGSGQASAPLPSEALAHMDGLDTAPAPRPAARAAAVDQDHPAEGFPWLAAAGALLALGLLGLGGSWAWSRLQRRQPARPAQAALAVPTPVRGPVPTPAPKGPAPARRDVVLATKNGFDTLPAALPPTTPQSAGQLP
jgi:hypothetical protein